MTKLISYAQNFEDVMLWRALGDVEGGFYIDVGAQSPKIDSVSRLFHQNGWRGIHIDPVVAYADELRSERPGDIVIQAAVAAHGGAVRFFEVPDTGLSTAQEDVAASHRESGYEVAELLVPAITLDDIFKQVEGQPVHWMKVDVEGAEADVLAGWVDSLVRPWIIVAEATTPSTRHPSHDVWEPALLARGYRFAYFDGLNRFYVSEQRSELLASFVSGPNIFDGFMLSPESSSPFCGEFRARISALEAAEQSSAAEVERLSADLPVKEREYLQEHERMSSLLGEAEQRHKHEIDAIALEAARLLEELDSKECEFLQEHNRMSNLLREAEQRRADELGAMQVSLQAALHHASNQHGEERGKWQATLRTVADQHVKDRAAWRADLAAMDDRLDERQCQFDKKHTSYEAKVESERHWQAVAEQRRYELNNVYASTSWRLTRPLRGLKRLVSRMAVGSKRAVRSVVRAQLLPARAPSLRDRLRGFAVRAGVIVGAGQREHGPAGAVSPLVPGLSRRGNAVLQRMRTAANGEHA